MSKIIRIDSGTDPKLVGDTGCVLMLAHRDGYNIIDGFIIPTSMQLINGASNEVMSAFDALHTKNVILRASYHPLRYDNEIIRNVKRDSLITTIEYMQKKAWRLGDNPAIIVQKDINAEISGTVHSINPVTQDEGEVLIEANLWMNETILSGESEPDMVLLDKNSGALCLESDDEDEICLTPRQIAELHSLAKHFESLLRRPVSIDWNYDNNKLYVLNIRPINEQTFARFRN